MAQISVVIAGRTYRMACNEGEEYHVESLARLLDGKIEGLRQSFGEIGDQRLVVMAALTIAEDLHESGQKIAALEARLANQDSWSGTIAEAMETAASRIEQITQGLNGAKTH